MVVYILQFPLSNESYPKLSFCDEFVPVVWNREYGCVVGARRWLLNQAISPAKIVKIYFLFHVAPEDEKMWCHDDLIFSESIIVTLNLNVGSRKAQVSYPESAIRCSYGSKHYITRNVIERCFKCNINGLPHEWEHSLFMSVEPGLLPNLLFSFVMVTSEFGLHSLAVNRQKWFHWFFGLWLIVSMLHWSYYHHPSQLIHSKCQSYWRNAK